MTIANTLTYLPQYGFDVELSQQGLHGMVMWVTFLVALLGGRVIPMFTANGTGGNKVAPLKWLEIIVLLSLFVLFTLIITDATNNPKLVGALCFLSAALHLFRQLRWRPWLTLKVPLIWSLYFSMLFITIGLLLMGCHFILASISFNTAFNCG